MDLATLKAVIQTPLQLVGEIVHLIKTTTIDYYKTTSLSEATKLTRVEPITVVSRDLANYENTSEIMQTLLNLFAGYYLQAVALTTRVNGCRVIRVLDSLNPDRDSSGFFASLESAHGHELMMADRYRHSLPRLGMEGRVIDVMTRDHWTADDLIQKEERPTRGGASFSGDLQKTLINEASNLAVGKLIQISIRIDEHNISVPVNIRLAAALLSEQAVSHIATIKKEDTSLLERFHSWRAGRISLIRDLMFCQDLIDEHRKALIADKDGVYSEIVRRVNNTKKYGLLTQNPSLVSASNLFVISEEVATDIEHKLGGRLSNARIREKMFDNSYAMIVAVVDRDYERVTFYIRGIATATNVSIRDIKAANKAKGPDIGDILASLVKGSAPSF